MSQPARPCFISRDRSWAGGVAFVLVTATAFTFPWVAGWPLYGLLIFIAGVAAVLRRHDAPSGDVLATGLGVAVGFAGLGKLNIAVVSLAVAAIAVVVSARYPRRSVLFFGVSSLFAFAGGWLITGQHPFDVIPYVRGAFDVSAGYSAAMGQVDPQTSWVSGVAALATVMLGALVWQRSTDLPRETSS